MEKVREEIILRKEVTKKAIKKHLLNQSKEKLADNYAYIFSADLDRVEARLLDSKAEYKKHLNKLVDKVFDNKQYLSAIDFKLSETSKKKDDPQLDLFKGLAGPQHEGIAKVAVNSCGRLNPGYKYVKGKGIVKVKQKSKDKPTQKEHSKLKKYQKQLEDLFSKVSDLETQKDNFQKKIDKSENFSEKNDLMREKFALVKKINNLLKEQTALVNIILAVDNSGDVISITDKKGKKHNDIADFTKVNTQEIVFDEETILTDKKPIYIPALDEKELERHGFVFDAIKTKEDTYLVSVNSFQDSKDNVFVLLTLDQLVLTSMYYTTRAKALYKQQAEDSTKRQKEYYNNLPEERRKKYFTVNSAKALYNSLPAKIKKKITLSEYEKLTWNEKEALYKPYKRYGSKRIKSKLDSKHMWASTHYMYERFVNPKATMPKPRTANPEVFEYWREFRQFLDFKINDINVQAQDYSDSRKKGLETAYGIKNTSKELFDKYGILIKRQNGSNLTVAQIENTQDAWQKILDTFGNLVPIAKDYGLKISHTGSTLVYARKALGVFNPNFNAISVSAKYGFENFTNIMAHEVAHLLDYLEGQKTGKRYASDNYESLAGQIAITFKKNMNAKSSSSYINSIKECFARALEQYFALQNYGDTATAYYIEMIGDLKQEFPYTQVDQYVGLTNFNTKIKPLIEEFLSSFKGKKNKPTKQGLGSPKPKTIEVDLSQVPDPTPKALGNPYTAEATNTLDLDRSKQLSVNTLEDVKADAALQTTPNKVIGLKSSLQQRKTAKPINYFNLSGVIAKFLGNLEKKHKESLSINISGPAGSMKTRFSFQFVDELLSDNLTVGFASLEEHYESALFRNKEDQYIKPQNLDRFYPFSDLPDTFEKFVSIVNQCDAFFTDSWQKLVEKYGNINYDTEFRKAIDGKILFTIFQETTDGKTRGGSKTTFDGDIILKVDVTPEDYTKNYVYAQKNRYETLPGAKYYIHDKKLITPQDEAAMQLPQSMEISLI